MTTITPGATFGNWRVVSIGGRGALCQCRCGTTRAVAIAALLDNSAAPSCGCQRLTSSQIEALRTETDRQRRERELRD
jgi:hypothetical protein